LLDKGQGVKKFLAPYTAVRMVVALVAYTYQFLSKINRINRFNPLTIKRILITK